MEGSGVRSLRVSALWEEASKARPVSIMARAQKTWEALRWSRAEPLLVVWTVSLPTMGRGWIRERQNKEITFSLMI